MCNTGVLHNDSMVVGISNEISFGKRHVGCNRPCAMRFGHVLCFVDHVVYFIKITENISV